MKKFPVTIGITDTNLCFNDCSTFLITFPPDEEYANNSKIGWNPWGYTFSFVYNFSTGTLLFSDDYTTLKLADSTIEDAIMALKVYEDGGETWAVEYREDVKAWKPAEYVPSKRIPNFGKWVKYNHNISSNDIYFPNPDYQDGPVKGGEVYQAGTNKTIDDFYKYLFGDGYSTLLKVSNAVVNYLKE